MYTDGSSETGTRKKLRSIRIVLVRNVSLGEREIIKQMNIAEQIESENN